MMKLAEQPSKLLLGIWLAMSGLIGMLSLSFSGMGGSWPSWRSRRAR